jgi:hypothetical protein
MEQHSLVGNQTLPVTHAASLFQASIVLADCILYTIFTKMQHESNLRQTSKTLFLPSENVFIQM